MLFASSRPLPDGTHGGIRIWEAERTAAGWGEPRPLPPPVNPPGSHWSGHPSVADDGTLYVSFDQNGRWTPARHLEHNINTEAEEEYPFLTPDGKYLFFSSERSPFTAPVAHRLNYGDLQSGLHSTLNGHGNVFFIGVEALELPQ